MRRTPRSKLLINQSEERECLSTHTCTTGMFSRRTLLCAASCVTKNISPRFSRTIFYRDANSVILRAHLCTAVASMGKLCSKSLTRSRFFMLSLESRLRHCIYVCLLLPSSPCTSFVSIMQALSFCSLCVPCPFFSQIRYCCLPNTNTTKRNIRHISDWSKCTVFDTPEPKLMQHTD